MDLFYIFLDVDGVLNNENYIEECYEKHHKPMHMNHVPFDPKCLNNLMTLVQILEKNKYDVKIILSSTWRLHQIDYEIVDARLAEYGMKLNDKTKYIKGIRGIEIKDYLNNHKKPSNFFILDDDIEDIVPYYPNNLINTKFKTGFDNEKLQEAINKMK